MSSWEQTALGSTEGRTNRIGEGAMPASSGAELAGDDRPTDEPGRKLNGSSRTLAQMRPGDRGLILAVHTSDERIHQRLLHMGMLRGRELVVVRRAPTGDPMEIRLLSYSLCLRQREASQVEVAPLP